MEVDRWADADLLTRLADRDEKALALVFDRHAAAVTRYAWRLADSRMDVEEIVQDTFLTAWRRAAEITLTSTSLLPWLLVTCRYLAMNSSRKAARNRADPLPDEYREGNAAASRARQDADDAREQLTWIMNEIDRLDPLDRQVCQLCLVHGLRYADAARELGISVGAVRQRLSRSRVRLRKVVMSDEV